MHVQWLMGLVLMTFVLEDAALLSASALVSSGTLLPREAFLACFIGISLGDLGLYWIGAAARKSPFGKRIQARIAGLKGFKHATGTQAIDAAILISRFIPGTRTLTYLWAGLSEHPPLRFFALTVASVFGWVAVSLSSGTAILSILVEITDSKAAVLLSVVVIYFVLRKLWSILADPWKRKASFQSWRKWREFEFWPAWLFYLPLIPVVIFLSIKHRSWRAPFLANPGIRFGGWIGESKWQLLSQLDPNDEASLRAALIESKLDRLELSAKFSGAGLSFPLVLKPDVGQRGFGVRIISDLDEAMTYLDHADFPVIAQELSRFDAEAGVFYIRYPTRKSGCLFSVTDKIFPIVVGDGRRRIGDLILQDLRARMIATTYFSRLGTRLDEIPADGEEVHLVRCGNHCQGAIFTNGFFLASEPLLRRFDEIASFLPNFHFGRFDIRYKSHSDLRHGTDFQIVEVNGAGAEATHVWDTRTRLLDAYRTLATQWAHVFAIGAEIERRSDSTPSFEFMSLIRECARVAIRSGKLTVSS